MKEITSLPLLNDRFSEKLIDNSLLTGYNTEVTDSMVEDLINSSLGEKIVCFANVFRKLVEHNTSGNAPIYIWVYIRGINLQVIHAEKIGENPNINIYQLIVRDYRGGLDITYTPKEYNGINKINQSINTIIVDLSDIDYIVLPDNPTVVVEGIRKHIMEDIPENVDEFAEWFNPIKDQLNRLFFNSKFRSFFMLFDHFNNEFNSKYTTWPTELLHFNGEYEELWNKYISIINTLLPKQNINDNVVIIVSDEDLEKQVEITSKSERMFTPDEIENMAKIVNKTIDVSIKS